MKISNKLTVENQAAYQCVNCKNEVHLLGNTIEAPKICGNCDHTIFNMLWAQKITTQTSVEPIPKAP